VNTKTSPENVAHKLEEAALELFSKKPFSSVTVDEIAMAAGFSKRTLYNHYPSKADLLVSILVGNQKKLYNQQEKALSACSTAEEVIYTHFRSLRSFTRENMRVTRILWNLIDYMGEGQIQREALTTLFEWTQKVARLPIDRLASMERTGLLQDYEPDVIIYYINALNKGLFLQFDKDAHYNIKSPSLDDTSDLAVKCLQCFLEHT